jgi:hypothetical protein
MPALYPELGGNWNPDAWLVNQTIAGEYLSCHDQALGLLLAFGQTSLHHKQIQPFLASTDCHAPIPLPCASADKCRIIHGRICNSVGSVLAEKPRTITGHRIPVSGRKVKPPGAVLKVDGWLGIRYHLHTYRFNR